MTNFFLDRPVPVPSRLSKHRYGKTDPHIAKENPNWIVTNSLETMLLAALQRGASIREASGIAQGGGWPTTAVEQATVSLLTNIDRHRFYEGATVGNKSKALHLYLTNACNLRCRHCYRDAGIADKDELDTAEWLSVLDQFTDIARGTPSQIVLSGGEVLTRPDFLELATHAKRQGHHVNVVTNGTLIASSEQARALGKVTDFLQISLDGATPAVNDRYRGTGTYKRIIDAINRFAGTDVIVNIGMVVSGANVDDITRNLPALIANLRHDRIKLNISGLMDYGRGSSCKGDGFSQGYIEQVFHSAKALGIKPKPWREPNTKAFDCGYARSITIDASGDAFYCPVGNAAVKAETNVRTTPLRDIFERFEAQNQRASVERIEGCGTCDLEYICAGGCRLENLSSRGSLLAPHCDPERKERIYHELIKLRTEA